DALRERLTTSLTAFRQGSFCKEMPVMNWSSKRLWKKEWVGSAKPRFAREKSPRRTPQHRRAPGESSDSRSFHSTILSPDFAQILWKTSLRLGRRHLVLLGFGQLPVFFHLLQCCLAERHVFRPEALLDLLKASGEAVSGLPERVLRRRLGETSQI